MKTMNQNNMSDNKNPNPINAVIICNKDLKEIPAHWESFKVSINYVLEGSRISAEFKVFAESMSEAERLADVMLSHKINPSSKIERT